MSLQLLSLAIWLLCYPLLSSTEVAESSTLEFSLTSEDAAAETVVTEAKRPRLLDTTATSLASNSDWIPIPGPSIPQLSSTTTSPTRRRVRTRRPTTSATTTTTRTPATSAAFATTLIPTGTVPIVSNSISEDTATETSTLGSTAPVVATTSATTTTLNRATTEEDAPLPVSQSVLERATTLADVSLSSATWSLDDSGNVIEGEAPTEVENATSVADTATDLLTDALTTQTVPDATSEIATTTKSDRSSVLPTTFATSTTTSNKPTTFATTTTSSTSLTGSTLTAVTAGNSSRLVPVTIPTEEPVFAVDANRAATAEPHAVSNTTVIAISVSVAVALLVVLVATVLIILVRRKRATKTCKPAGSPDSYSLDNVSPPQTWLRGKLRSTLRSSKRSYSNQAFEDPAAVSNPLSITQLSLFLEKSLSEVDEEFQQIPTSPAVRLEELPAGCEVKNRYANVLPIPETRVRIRIPEDSEAEDAQDQYINANYIQGSKGEPRYYIACQAPLESTVDDFWQMVWENRSEIIIQLTDLMEGMATKSAEYIPPSEVLDCHRQYGQYQVTMKKRELRDNYVKSYLQLKHMEQDTSRDIVHLWYSWPSTGVPQQSSPVVNLLKEARRGSTSQKDGGDGPVIVHCSPGTGRTGTVLAIDILMKHLDQNQAVDVPRCVYRLRRDRAGCVQTKEQYDFIYKALNFYAAQICNGTLDSL